MRRESKAVLGLVALGLTAFLAAGMRPALAAPVVLDFEGLPGMTFWQGNPIPLESRLQEQFLSDGVRFDSPSGYAAIVQHGQGHATSGVNGIGSATNIGTLTYHDEYPMVLTFWDPNDPTRRATTDFVSARGDLWGGSAPVSMRGYNLKGNLIASVTVADTGGETVAISVSGIHRVELMGGRDTGFDDLTFNPPVPEPSQVRVFRIGFEEIPGIPSPAPGQVVPLETALSDQYLATHGVRFSSGPGYAAVAQQGRFANSGVNAIGGATEDNRLTYEPASPIDISFWNPSAPASPATTDYVSIRGDTDPEAGAGMLTLEAFGPNGALLATDTKPDIGGTLLEVSVPGILQVRVTGNGSTAFDNLVFHRPVNTLRVTPLSSTVIHLKWWDWRNDEAGYRIEMKYGTGAFVQIGGVGPNVLTFDYGGLTPSTAYTFRVRVYGAFGSAYTSEGTATTLPLPVAPSNAVASPLSSTQIGLSWTDNSPDETGFKIEAKQGLDPYKQVGGVGAKVTTFIYGGLAPDTNYRFRVRAVRGADYSAYSNVARATTLPLPAAPTNLIAAALSSTQIKLTWQDRSSNETGFKIERKTSTEAFVPVGSVGAGVASAVMSGLTPKTAYSFRVLSYRGGDYSAYSNQATATTTSTDLAATPLSSTRMVRASFVCDF